MASWRKLLSQMANDPDPRGYTFEDAAKVLALSRSSLYAKLKKYGIRPSP